MVNLTPKFIENIFRIIFILASAKNYNSNFVDSTFGTDYCLSSNASLTEPSNQHYFSNNCVIFEIEFFLFLNFLQIHTKL